MDVLQKLLDAVRGLTFTNVAILAVLVILLIPVYFGYRMLGDPQLMGAVFSVYSELTSPTDCNLAFQQPAGGTGVYVIRLPITGRNREVWLVGVSIRFKPDDVAMKDYCTALDGLADYLRNPWTSKMPTFPGSDRPILPVEKHP